MHTFQVDSVLVEEEPLSTEPSYLDVWKAKTKQQDFLATNNLTRSLVLRKPRDISDEFMRSVHLAYACHYPLSISPDHIWLLIALGLSKHVNSNAEELQKEFVQFSGKEKIVVFTDENPNWANVVEDFSSIIKKYIGEQTHSLLVANFSTTTATERLCSEIVMMDALKSFFSYEVRTLCGIPSITLEGTPEDWEQIRQRAAGLEKYNFKWWTDHLLPILDEFVLAAYGKPNINFWKKMYKQYGGSGGPYISGWITDLYPYLKDSIKNNYMGVYKQEDTEIFTTHQFKGSLSMCPAKYDQSPKPLNFCAGFIGVSQDKQTRTIRPELGWAVLLSDEKPTK